MCDSKVKPAHHWAARLGLCSRPNQKSSSMVSIRWQSLHVPPLLVGVGILPTTALSVVYTFGQLLLYTSHWLHEYLRCPNPRFFLCMDCQLMPNFVSPDCMAVSPTWFDVVRRIRSLAWPLLVTTSSSSTRLKADAG